MLYCVRTLTPHSSRKPPPVGKDKQWQVLPIHVIDGLGCLEGRVRKPHLTSLADHLPGWQKFYYPLSLINSFTSYLDLCVWIGRVGWDGALDTACLHRDDPTGNPPKPCPSRNNSHCPVAKGLNEATMIKETFLKLHIITYVERVFTSSAKDHIEAYPSSPCLLTSTEGRRGL